MTAEPPPNVLSLEELEGIRQLIVGCRSIQDAIKFKGGAYATASLATDEHVREEATIVVQLAKTKIRELPAEALVLRDQVTEVMAWAWADKHGLIAPESLEWGLARAGRVPPRDEESKAEASPHTAGEKHR